MPKWCEPEDDYVDWGRSLAAAIVNGATTQKGSLELMRAMGYGRDKLREWIKRYRLEEPRGDKLARAFSARRLKRIQQDLERADRIAQDEPPASRGVC